MTVRGIYGFRVAGRDLLTYNHERSTPDHLGSHLVSHFRMLQARHGDAELLAQIEAIQLVLPGQRVEGEQLKAIDSWIYKRTAKHLPDQVRNYRDAMVYARGHLDFHAETGLLIDYSFMMTCPDLAEYGYLFNLDDGTLEVYSAMLQEPHSFGRYAYEEPTPSLFRSTPCYPMALIFKRPIKDLDDRWTVAVRNTLRGLRLHLPNLDGRSANRLAPADFAQVIPEIDYLSLQSCGEDDDLPPSAPVS